METIDGGNIKRAYTLKSWWDNDSIEVEDNRGKCYRIKVEELLKLIKRMVFVKKKAIKHTYLVVGGIVAHKL